MMNGPLAVGVRRACEMIGIQRTLLYSLMNSGHLSKCKVGRRTLITVKSINELLAAESKARSD